MLVAHEEVHWCFKKGEMKPKMSSTNLLPLQIWVFLHRLGKNNSFFMYCHGHICTRKLETLFLILYFNCCYHWVYLNTATKCNLKLLKLKLYTTKKRELLICCTMYKKKTVTHVGGVLGVLWNKNDDKKVKKTKTKLSDDHHLTIHNTITKACIILMRYI